jgi:hypothetical protein
MLALRASILQFLFLSRGFLSLQQKRKKGPSNLPGPVYLFSIDLENRKNNEKIEIKKEKISSSLHVPVSAVKDGRGGWRGEVGVGDRRGDRGGRYLGRLVGSTDLRVRLEVEERAVGRIAFSRP